MNFRFYKKITFYAICIITFLYGCSPKQESVQVDNTKETYSTLLQKNAKNEDSLQMMLQEQIKAKNDVKTMLSYKYLGRNQRENANFTEAVKSHQHSLDLAKKLRDTIEIIESLNDLGTDFRRIGAMSEAADYHYEALRYADAFSDVLNSGRKARVMAINGIGNISQQLGYYDDAEGYFRMALKEETALGSDIGQAINYANIGSIFKHQQQYDSARVYYNRSLEKNIRAGSKLGIGLCHIHLGNIYQLEGKYEFAEKEYLEAYNLMENSSDRWHWLNACMALANIYLQTSNLEEYSKYITLAEKTANEVASPEHISEIYKLKHDYAAKQNDFQGALEHYKQSIVMKDSVQGVKNTNRYMDLRMNYEREQNTRQLKQMQTVSQIREREKQRLLKIAWGVMLIGLIISGALYYAYYQRTRSNRLLKELERARTDFFTNITHEFRTPLTVIQGLNRQLQEKKGLSEKEKNKFMDAINRQSENLLKLVNQLLEISKLRGGTDNPEWKKDDIISYLRMTAETFRLYAKEKNINLIFYTDIVAQEMDFIPFYMDKIISNLLSNAIKHIGNGDKVNFIVVRGKKNDTIVIRIADNGEGIPKEEQDKIFDLFYQSPKAKNVIGTGIGLAFTKMLVEKMKGKIEVQSQLNEGTIFTVTLPLKNKNIKNISHTNDKITPSATIPTNDFEEDLQDVNDSPRASELPIILVVEDNKDVSLYIKSLLENRYNVIVAKNGEEGVIMTEKYLPDLVITDVMMPIKNGYELCKRIKDNELTNHTPIVMLTAKNSEKDRLQGLKYGAEAYIKKPFLAEELLICIEKILENRKILKEKYLNIIETNGCDNKLHNDDNMKFLQKVINIIHSELNNPEFNATFVADKMAISTSQLSRKLNQITGFSTSSYILQVKFSKAKKMLHNTSITVGEVADTCGFYDLSYFSRMFKKEFGITPSQYQKNILMNINQ